MKRINNTNTPTPETSSREHKGGRHKKADKDKRIVCKKVYFTVEQSKAVELAADKNNISDSKYIADMTFEGKVVAPISQEFAQDFHCVATMSNNLNQLAHRANAAGYATVAKEMLVELTRLRGALDILYANL